MAVGFGCAVITLIMLCFEFKIVTCDFCAFEIVLSLW